MIASQRKPYRGMAMEGVIAAWYDRTAGRDMRRFQRVFEAVMEQTPSGGNVLEVAPGPGYLAIEIAKSGRRVSALDISNSFVRIARANAGRAGAAVYFLQGNAAAMPYPDASFDFAVCVAAFKNFGDPLGALNEIHRVLKPG